jgi:DNA-binding MarR family transcriptional regulator
MPETQPTLPTLLAPRSLDDLLLYRLHHVQSVAGRIVVRWCEGDHGITRREWRLISLLADAGSLQPSQLADRAQLDRARTSKSITSLVDKALIVRTARPDDRRQVTLALSPAGQAIHSALYPKIVALNLDMLSALRVNEVVQLEDALTRLEKQAKVILAQSVLPKANRRLGKPQIS